MKEKIGKPLFDLLEKQARPEEDVALIKRAYDFAYAAHDGQLRKSEDPYIIHPVEVACILAEINADCPTVCSCLLHDVLEDCDVTPKAMEEAFGPEIRRIVEGVTKLGKFSFSSKEERQAENFRKLLIAMAEDVRVVLVKLADRLHNMRTLDHMAPHKQAEKAKETLEIYAPLANRFGLGQMKWELEDLGLKYLHPDEYAEIERLVADSREDREELLTQIKDKLRKELDNRHIKAEIVGRPKHFFGIWKKLRSQQKSFQELYDVLAVRVIIDSADKNFCELEDDPDTQRCYEVMGIVHAIFKPIPGRFKDYIAMPKFNGYQSLHTAVIGNSGKPVEIQMRTKRMHHIAEYGIAAHWAYKEAGDSVKADSDTAKKLAWLRQLVDWQQDLKDASEYLEEVKMDLFADEVFVFSPRGDVIDLPSGSCPIDFAYRIHTDIGHRCIGARINDRIVPLNTVLKNGDIVEIITSKNTQPKMDWLNFANTHGAKNRIRQWFKKHHRDEHIQQGKQMLEAELGRGSMDEFFKSDKLKEVGRRLNLTDPNDILAAIGYGDLSVCQVVNRLREIDQQEKVAKKGYALPQSNEKEKASNISSLGGLLHHLAKCCQPVPGEEIIGVVTRGSGIAVHRSDCGNLSRIEEERRMAVDWAKERTTTYPAALQIDCLDRVGIAGDILKKVSDHKVNLKDLRVDTHREKKTATIFLLLDVVDIEQLARVSQAISQISDVIRVHRRDHRKRGSAA
jgi:RelA/SpoT family (p)ppGpp synthetase